MGGGGRGRQGVVAWTGAVLGAGGRLHLAAGTPCVPRFLYIPFVTPAASGDKPGGSTCPSCGMARRLAARGGGACRVAGAGCCHWLAALHGISQQQQRWRHAAAGAAAIVGVVWWAGSRRGPSCPAGSPHARRQRQAGSGRQRPSAGLHACSGPGGSPAAGIFPATWPVGALLRVLAGSRAAARPGVASATVGCRPGGSGGAPPAGCWRFGLARVQRRPRCVACGPSAASPASVSVIGTVSMIRRTHNQFVVGRRSTDRVQTKAAGRLQGCAGARRNWSSARCYVVTPARPCIHQPVRGNAHRRPARHRCTGRRRCRLSRPLRSSCWRHLPTSGHRRPVLLARCSRLDHSRKEVRQRPRL